MASMITHAEELNALVCALLPFAQHMIQEHGAFLPFGAIVTSGVVEIAQAGFDDVQASVLERVEKVRTALRRQASDDACAAVGYCMDIKLTHVPSGEVSDAVHLVFEHRSGEAFDVMFPYSNSDGRVEFSPPMVRLAAGGLFTTLPDLAVN